MATQKLHISGMTCLNCQERIEKKLKKTKGVTSASVSYSEGRATVTYDETIISPEALIAAVAKLGYGATVIGAEKRRPGAGSFLRSGVARTIGVSIVIVALFFILERLGFTQLFSGFQLAEPGMGYGFIFVLGLVTSLHCVAMCGGINLSQSIPTVTDGEGESPGAKPASGRFTALWPALLYNSGRVVSYTVVGAIVGAVGFVITPSGMFRGVVQLIAGVFMVIVGLNMLGIVPGLRKLTLRLPKPLADKVSAQAGRSKSPLVVGLLNGLMPCGPLQAMQLFALSTASPLDGALAMLLFSVGTVPLMFGLSVFGSLMGLRFRTKAMAVGAVLVAVLGLSMFSQGLNLSGVDLPLVGGGSAPVASGAVGSSDGNGSSTSPASGFSGTVKDGVQEVKSTLSARGYPAITVQAGTPVKWIIDAPKGSITGCNNALVIPEYNLEHAFEQGENIIEFTPTKTGVFQYTCWMGMIKSTITVVE